MDEWTLKALNHIKAGKFTLQSGRPDGATYCCMKFRDGSGGMPKIFGVIYETELTSVYLRDKKSDITEEKITFASVEALLAAGWDVD